MVSKIYYGVGFLVLVIYSIVTVAPYFHKKAPLPTFSFGPKRMEKGKYVPYTPSRNSSGGYSSGGSDSGGGSSSRRSTSSFPSGGGYSGGK
ncbi:MAG: hypothetical protein JSS81_05330 [Acidobacteria bacterium]|nr:hypothetical protein [Acidobacteriota bacterium]